MTDAAAAALYRPGPAEFANLAARYPVVPVWREVLADLQTPLGVFDRLRGDGPAFLLESVEQGERWGRYSFLGFNPFARMRGGAGRVEVTGRLPTDTARDVVAAAATGDPLHTLQTLVANLRAPNLKGLPPLFAGAVGYLGYDVVRFIEHLPDSPHDDLGMDDARLDLPGQVVAFDHLRQRLMVITNVVDAGSHPADAWAQAVQAGERLVARLAQPAQAPPVAPPQAVAVTDATPNMPKRAYLEAVGRAQEHIRAGDAFQVVPSQRFSLRTDTDPFTVYRVLRLLNPSPYMYLFDYDDLQVVGSSPEALVTVSGRRASIQPIAGSRSRSPDAAADAALERSLRADEKERAEHVMLVDLARNDLGRVCAVGSVDVTEFMQVVRYSHVMHLVSRVTGRLRDGVGPVDVVRATFPAGTLTGAPKVRAMQIIDSLEPTRRGLYGGGIGYVDLAGNVDLCIAIRTLVFRDGWAHVQAGAGVVADSVPEREYAETQDKAMALLAAVRAAKDLCRGG